MRILYHTPLKPPGHNVPSGDRAMARALRDLLRADGDQVITLDRQRRGKVLQGPGQLALDRAAMSAEMARSGLPGADMWLTYHCYYKRPDWIGPDFARQARIPYVLAEVSYAPKRAGGPWDIGHRQVAACIGAAGLILNFNPNDAACVRPLMNQRARMVDVPPFIATRPFAAARLRRAEFRNMLARRHKLPADIPWLMTVAMMRPGDKLASYRLLGEALAPLLDRRWRLIVVGDGMARAEVEAALKPIRRRCLMLGEMKPADLPQYYAASDLYVWPAINEAWGMSLIEAQAAGLPVVAGRTGGVPNVVIEGGTALLPAVRDGRAFGAAVAQLIADMPRRMAMAEAAASYAPARHDRRQARAMIGDALRRAKAEFKP